MKTLRPAHRMILVLIATVLLAAPAIQAGPPPWIPTIAGTWYFSTSLAAVTGPGTTVPGMATFHEDGTLVYTDALMFGMGAKLGFAVKIAPYHGVWRMTGKNKFGGTGIGLLFAPAPGTTAPDVVVGFIRSRSELRYDGSLSRIVGTIYIETTMCETGPLSCPDPTDPDVVWVPFGDPVQGFPVALSRVSRVPAGPLQ